MDDDWLKDDPENNKEYFVNLESGVDQSAVDFSSQNAKDKFLGGSSTEKKGADGSFKFKLGKPFPYKEVEGDFRQVDFNKGPQNGLIALFKTRDLVPRGMKDLAEGTISLINKNLDKDIDTIFFLDKSARPAAYLFRETWRRLLPDKKLPNVCFINIGRYQSRSRHQRQLFELPQLSDDTLNYLRKKFDGIEDDKILVADEFVNTGESLKRAVGVIGKVFPEASVEGTGIYKHQVQWRSGVQEVYNGGQDDYFTKPDRDPQYLDPAKDMRATLSKFASVIAENTERIPRGKIARLVKMWRRHGMEAS